MKSDNLYSQMMDVKDDIRKSTTSRNLYATAGTVATAMSIMALSQALQAQNLVASLGTGSLLAAGATISFYKFDKKVDELRQLKRDLINLKHSYDRERLTESQVYRKRIRSKKAA